MSGIQEIASATGLSKATVSRALRGLPSVSPATAETVRRVADEIGYVPSSAAAGLATGRQRAIGVVVPVIDRWFYTKTIEGVDEELRRAGYDLVLFSLGQRPGLLGPARDRSFGRAILRQRVDALVLLSLVLDEAERAELRLTEHPMIVIGGAAPGIRTIGIDDDAAARLATRHLLGLGHRAIAYIGGVDEAGINVALPYVRRNAFLDECRAAGVDVPDGWLCDGGFSFAGGHRAMGGLLDGVGDSGRSRAVSGPAVSGAVSSSRSAVPTAVFAASDEMALGAMAAIAQRGLRIPEDVSVIGIDGHEFGEVVRLTTIAQDPRAQGAAAARALLDDLAGVATEAAFAPSPMELVVRGSTGVPRG